jgi:hypothetical protein
MHPSDIPDIRARELLTVMALAEYGSFVAAASYLKTSQPALTRTIKRVERVLGVTCSRATPVAWRSRRPAASSSRSPNGC